MAATRIETDRLVLRDWTDDDLRPFAALNADPEVMQHFPAPMSRTESDALAGRIHDRIAAEGWGLWAVEVASSGRFVGFTGLSVPSFTTHFTPAVEIGWRLAREAWGYGYATEAARAALGYGFGVLDLEEIVSFTAVTNDRSQAVMRRIGMSHSASDDFDHPRIEPGHRLSRHVLYRLPVDRWRAS
ncbi:GNAT family N-acetyltransferase [Luteipulveratus sp. YIM 133132]|uniref:GNAT family N-acetyltransferase n=1 Tax=Luteipulveratus flavus TaxID=3031728 RepID=UPI0023B1F851|nr:GNAT family N-acetyltransferase [Luteipulveratus sp. YIM 133132]MDE9367651.1 GNAT family N-acetyltransferase [Luteipulveratus sp. YIM 133132]